MKHVMCDCCHSSQILVSNKDYPAIYKELSFGGFYFDFCISCYETFKLHLDIIDKRNESEKINAVFKLIKGEKNYE